MKTPGDELPPDVRALLERERAVPPIPPAARGRAMARARAAVAASPVSRTAVRTHPPRIRWAVAACLTFAAAAAIGAGAYEVRVHLAARSSPQPALRPAAPAAPASPPVAKPVEAPAPAPELVEAPVPAPVGGPGRQPTSDAARQELRLLRLAREAVARQDFAAALAPIAEHARRFKDGRLAEEREALRVRALAGLGRTDEARRAAERFEARFPRSVLLPAVRQMKTPPP
jgi:hypothetical protein